VLIDNAANYRKGIGLRQARLAWTLYELARHLDSADRGADEARAAWYSSAEQDPLAGVPALDALPFTAAVVDPATSAGVVASATIASR
jgi:hypothetical protein